VWYEVHGDEPTAAIFMYLEDGGFSVTSTTFYTTTHHFIFVLSIPVYRGWEETTRLNKMLNIFQ
jgi:hypothetical protein